MSGPLATLQLVVQARYFDRVNHGSRPEGEIVYTYYADGAFAGRATLDASTKRSLLKRLYDLTEGAEIAGWTVDARLELAKIGQRLFSLVVPEEVRRTVLDPTGPPNVELDVQDHDVPWELLHDGVGFLSERLALGRRLIRPSVDRPVGRKAVRVVVVGDPMSDLAGAQIEADMVETRCAAALQALEQSYRIKAEVISICGDAATKDAVLLDTLMESDREIDIFHFAGHARFDARNPEHSGLVLADGDLRGFEARSIASTPLVFVNGCRAGHNDSREALTYGSVSGLAGEFLAGGAVGYIGPMWPIKDSVATAFAEIFYDALIGGATIGHAVLAAKQRLTDTDALSYVFYGAVDERLAIFSPQLTSGPYVNDLGVHRIIEIERDYPRLELLAVNDLPWILWDVDDIVAWVARIAIDDARKESVVQTLLEYLREFGDKVLEGQKRFLCIVNAPTIRQYVRARGVSRWLALSRLLDRYYVLENFCLILADIGDAHMEEIELVSRSSAIPPAPDVSVYVFNKQTRYEQHNLTYNLFEDYNVEMIEHYWHRFRDVLGRAIEQYDIEIDESFGPELFARVNAATRVKLAKLAEMALAA